MAFWVEPGGGGTQLSFRTNHPSGMMHYNGPLTIEAWHQLAMQILWSENAGTGRVSVWLDGEKIVDDVAAKTKPDSNRVFVQVGYHRNAPPRGPAAASSLTPMHPATSFPGSLGRGQVG